VPDLPQARHPPPPPPPPPRPLRPRPRTPGPSLFVGHTESGARLSAGSPGASWEVIGRRLRRRREHRLRRELGRMRGRSPLSRSQRACFGSYWRLRYRSFPHDDSTSFDDEHAKDERHGGDARPYSRSPPYLTPDSRLANREMGTPGAMAEPAQPSSLEKDDDRPLYASTPNGMSRATHGGRSVEGQRQILDVLIRDDARLLRLPRRSPVAPSSARGFRGIALSCPYTRISGQL